MTFWQGLGYSGLLAGMLGFLYWYEFFCPIDPKDNTDGYWYLELARGESVPFPFSLRWLVPRILGPKIVVWVWTTRVVLILSGVVFYWLLTLRGLSSFEALIGVALFCGTPGVFAYQFLEQVLVDPLALFLTLLGAALTLINPILGIPVVLLAGFSKENSPILAALFAWSWWPLIGLIAPVLSHFFFSKPARYHAEYTDTSTGERKEMSFLELLQNIRRCRGTFLQSLDVVVLPWGITIWAFCLNPTLGGVLALGVAYGTFFISTDGERVYQVAIGAIAGPAAVLIAHSQWCWVLLLLHYTHFWSLGFVSPLWGKFVRSVLSGGRK